MPSVRKDVRREEARFTPGTRVARVTDAFTYDTVRHREEDANDRQILQKGCTEPES